MKIYKFNIGLLLCILIFIPVLHTHAQKSNQSQIVIIESAIKDKEGNPIPNATIHGAEGSKIAFSDEQGYFRISVPSSSELVIEADGYNREIISTVRVTNNIILTQSHFLESEKDIVQIPFGKTTKSNIVNTTIVVNPRELLNYDQNISIYNALQAKVPGLIGASNIRGMGDALIVVDGVPRSIDYINLTEVEQITILKDVNAAALYGTQAKTGVILITTKRGEPLKKQINVRINQKMSFPIAYPSYLCRY